MTIDEAIEHAEERACGNDQCAKDHAQLADWLRELRQARLTIEILKIFRDGFKEDAQKYKAENDKLRELIRTVWLAGDFRAFLGADEIEERMRELGIEVDEAIERARRASIDKADESLNCNNECAREYWQLAEWLTELKATKAENDKLRERMAQLIRCARVGKENVSHYQPTRDGCGFDCVANGEHCSFAKICDHARTV